MRTTLPVIRERIGELFWPCSHPAHIPGGSDVHSRGVMMRPKSVSEPYAVWRRPFGPAFRPLTSQKPRDYGSKVCNPESAIPGRLARNSAGALEGSALSKKQKRSDLHPLVTEFGRRDPRVHQFLAARATVLRHRPRPSIAGFLRSAALSGTIARRLGLRSGPSRRQEVALQPPRHGLAAPTISPRSADNSRDRPSAHTPPPATRTPDVEGGHALQHPSTFPDRNRVCHTGHRPLRCPMPLGI
jgi:hypothetical protein